MSGKGSRPRPFSVSQDTYADNFARTFGATPIGARLGATQSSKVCNDSSILSAPATQEVYVDDETGQEVTESWWPGDKHDLP